MAVSVIPLPALVFLAGSVGAPAASAASRAVDRPSLLFCSADFNPDGLAGRATLSSVQGSTYVHFSSPGKSKPLSLRVGKRILGVLTFDRDGNTDVVALKTDLRVRVWLSDGHGRFVRQNQFGPGIARGKLSPSDEQEPALCCSSIREDGANLPRVTRDLAADGPQLARSQALASSQHVVEDAFFTAIHPRGPPLLPLAW